MSFSRFYGAVREMIRSNLLETQTARDIVRKSGARAGGAFVAHQDVLWAQGWMPQLLLNTQWRVSPYERPGVWGFWPTRLASTPPRNPFPYSVPSQYGRTDLKGVAYARVVVNITSGGGVGAVAWVPAYTTERAPLSTGVLDTGSLAHWKTPDGHTLLEWDEDLTGPRSYSWPPKGACVPTTPKPPQSGPLADLSGCYAGRWAPPPDIGQDAATVAIAIITNPTQEFLDENPGLFNQFAFAQVQSMAAQTPEWQGYFAAEIDD